MKLLELPINKLRYACCFIYVFFSIFEFYINLTIGHISRYFMLGFSLLFLLCAITNKNHRHVSIIQGSVLLWFIYSLLSIIWSSNTSVLGVYIFTFITMSVLWLCSYDFKLNQERMNSLLTFFQVCSLVLCILGVFFSKAFSNIGDNSTRYVLYIGGNRSDPNYLVSLYVIAFQIGLYRIVEKKERLFFNSLAILISVYVILFSGSRSGIVILVVSFIIIARSILFSRINARKIISIFILILLFLIFYRYLIRFIPASTLERVFGTGNLSFMDSTNRIATWERDFEEWKNPLSILWGMGFGANTTHSTILTFLFEFGLIGFSFFFIPNLFIIIQCVKKKNMLALALYLSGITQAFLCPATQMRFFWNALIIPVWLLNSDQGAETR